MNGGMGLSYGQAAQGVGNLFALGAGAIWGDQIFGKKPKVAPWIPIDLGAEQGKAVSENVGAFPGISNLGDLYTNYLQGQLEKVLPDYKSILAGGSQTTKDILAEADPLIKGQIPQDVQDAIRRSDAYTSLMSGTAGSPMSKALTARDFGLTSLDLQQRGANLAMEGSNAFGRWNQIAKGNIYDPREMFVTPAQQAALSLKNEEEKQAYLQNKYNVAAAPNPTAQGLYNTYLSMLSQVGGSGGRGGGGGGGLDIGSLMSMFGGGGGGSTGPGGWDANSYISALGY